MNYGLYLSASGMLTALHRLDVAANNLANVNTTAFKADLAAAAHRDAARVEDNLFSVDSNTLLDRLGGGVLSAPTKTVFAPAAPETTGRPLDVAILGKGFFVLDAAGSGSADEVRFTRDGRFTLDARGRLVSATTGDDVLDTANQPITISTTSPVSITSTGTITQDGRTIATLQIASVPDTDSLTKVGDNLYRADPAVADTRQATGALVQGGALESSGVNPIQALKDVTDAGKDVRNSSRLLSMHDQLMDSAINTFGRVA